MVNLPRIVRSKVSKHDFLTYPVTISDTTATFNIGRQQIPNEFYDKFVYFYCYLLDEHTNHTSDDK